MLDDKNFQIIACELHYSRIPQEYWQHRIQMVKGLGCNTVSVYVMWNFHEPEQGNFDFSSYGKNLSLFLTLIKEQNMWALIRPGPYICGEWDFGGHPYWLLKDKFMQLRSTDQKYINAITPYVQQLSNIISPLQCTQGGPIIMLQVENEYGYWGNNNSYPNLLKQLWEDTQMIQIPYYTADSSSLLQIGAVSGGALGLNPGINAQQWQNKMKLDANIPGLSSETYPGWLTHWGELWAHKTAVEVLTELKFLLINKYSFSIYMAHGGTNFGYYAGANLGQTYQPDVTSYDYDAPITESGHTTQKYTAIRDLMLLYVDENIPKPPNPFPMIQIDNISVKFASTIFDNLPQNFVITQFPQPMEYNDQDFGFILYSTNLWLNQTIGAIIQINDLHDYANVYIQGQYYCSLNRGDNQNSFPISQVFLNQSIKLDILVEGMGRINFNQSMMMDHKGITKNVTINGQLVSNWRTYSLPFKNISNIVVRQQQNSDQEGIFFTGSFQITQGVGDVYLDMSRWSKGFVWVNNKNLGRYWNIGPQYHLFCPGVWLINGTNTITVLDMHLKKPQQILTKQTLMKQNQQYDELSEKIQLNRFFENEKITLN